jgi:lipid-A-disaccharide synthase-like uncharacterized protein
MTIGPWVAAALLSASHSETACPACGHEKITGMWLMVGFLGQAIFTARFLAQWIASEKRKDSVVPVVFWWLSLAGGLTLLSYAIRRQDPVIIAGQSMGVFIYLRNLMLVAKGRRRQAKRSAREAKAREAAGAVVSNGPIPHPHLHPSQPASECSHEEGRAP